MLESAVWRWAVALLLAAAIIALVAYARGPHGRPGREPDMEHAGPAALAFYSPVPMDA